MTGPAPSRAPDVDGIAGPLLFARYAYPPNALGYCGPADPAAFAEAAVARDVGELAHRAAGFDGAWPYLRLIAACNGIGDPLDPLVVEAYWVGNPLLLHVPASTLAASLTDRFDQRAGRHSEALVAAAPAGGVPHHTFHVFAVYPWLGLLRAGMEGPPMVVLDRCRIRWGRVESVDGDTATVRTNPLRFDGSALTLGPARVESAVVSPGISGSDTAPSPGSMVSLHWDWVCDTLSPAQLGWLRACTATNLAAVNSLASPGPAVVCDA